MKILSLFLALLLSPLFFVSCGGSSGGGSSSSGEDREEDSGTIIYDSEVTTTERRALNAGTAAMSSLNIDGGQVERFSEVFGGTRPSDVVDYFQTRIKYALSAQTDIDDRIIATERLRLAEVVASNIGIELWYIAKAYEQDYVIQFEINGQAINIPSSRVGVMQVGDPFAQMSEVEQVTVLLHEGRHSDCTGGTLASDLERYRAGLAPLNNSCGHLHVNCPPDHPLAGLPACDELPWGAYVVGAIYAQAVSETCSSCSQTQKFVAEQLFLDSKSRLLYDFEELVDGAYGPPNMSSSTQVR